MGRYLPREYTPIPDALLRSGSDLVDVARRIARNQNWIWANQGNVFAAFGHEPSTTQEPTVVGAGSLDVAYFAAPLRSSTGSPLLRVCGYVAVTGDGTTIGATLRLYQLLPGEARPGPDTPYDDVVVASQPAGIGLDQYFTFAARVRSGANPLRFCLRLIGTGTATYTVRTVTALWEANPVAVLGESVEAWTAVSQSYVVANRSVSAALLRAVSNRTLGLIAQTPRPAFCHSFMWPRRNANTGAGATTEAGRWIVRTSALQPEPWVTIRPVWQVNGQGAKFRCTAYARVVNTGAWLASVNGTVFATAALVGGSLYSGDATDAIRLKLPAGEFIEIGVGVNIGGGGSLSSDATSSYVQHVGATLLGVTITQDAPTAAELALPGVETVPATYQPLDDYAASPGRPIVAQNDRLGRRAGMYYLVRNLVWLAANRNAHTLVADWVHRTTAAGYNAPNDAGDGLFRNTTVPTRSLGAAWPGYAPVTGWADRAAPVNAYAVNGTGTNHPGHHRNGSLLARLVCSPMTGGKVGGIIRPDLLYQPNSPWEDNLAGEIVGGVGHDPSAFPYFRVGADPSSARSGFRVCAPAGAKPSAGTAMAIVGGVPADKVRHAPGMQVALHAAYIHELPLTQADLDALP